MREASWPVTAKRCCLFLLEFGDTERGYVASSVLIPPQTNDFTSVQSLYFKLKQDAWPGMLGTKPLYFKLKQYARPGMLGTKPIYFKLKQDARPGMLDTKPIYFKLKQDARPGMLGTKPIYFKLKQYAWHARHKAYILQAKAGCQAC